MVDRGVARKQQPVGRNRDDQRLFRNPVAADIAAKQAFAARQRLHVARMESAPGPLFGAADHCGRLPVESGRDRGVDDFERSLLDARLDRVLHPLRHAGREPGTVGHDGLAGAGEFDLREEAAPLRNLVKRAAAVVAHGRFDEVESRPQIAADVVNVVLIMLRIGAGRPVPDPLSVDFQAVVAVGGDQNPCGGRNRFETEITTEDRTEIEAAAVGVGRPDPRCGDVHGYMPAGCW